jgi:diadenosine tetraphosphate (Ap4A) HIT family hydrolase
MMPCCSTWDGNRLLFETALTHARLDGFPVTPGHALIIPKRHVVSFVDLTTPELLDVWDLIADVCQASDADDFTIGVNDGPAAGRTVDHLHIHVIPRRAGDVPDPRGGVRRVLIPEVEADPWTRTSRVTR